MLMSLLMKLFRGFTNWKEGTQCFREHEKRECHRIALETLTTLPKTPNIGELLSSSLAKDREQNRRCLLKILRCLRSRQGCAIRGDLGQGNLMQLMKVMSEDPKVRFMIITLNLFLIVYIYTYPVSGMVGKEKRKVCLL